MQRDNAACLESLERFVDLALVPLIYQGISSMKTQASELSTENGGSLTTDEVMKELLGEVRNWTQVLLDDEVKRIQSKISYLNKLLTALFVMKVKVLSCINMKKNTDDFPLTVPSNHTFIHQVYIYTCKSIRDNPVALNTMEKSILEPIIINAIRCAEFECLQWNDLLEWGLGDVSPNDVLNEMIHDRVDTPENDQGSSMNMNNELPLAANANDNADYNADDNAGDYASLANSDKKIDDDDDDASVNDEDTKSINNEDDNEEKNESGDDGENKEQEPSFLNDDEEEHDKNERSSSPSFF